MGHKNRPLTFKQITSSKSQAYSNTVGSERFICKYDNWEGRRVNLLKHCN